jgi:hypothetical protein
MKKIKKEIIIRYLIEFIIVFLGVYIAFLLSGAEEAKKNRERQNQIISALSDEVKLLAIQVDKTAGNVEEMLKQYEEAIEKGNFPLPFVLQDPIFFTPHMWNAVLQADGLNLMDVEKMKYFSLYYNQVQQTVYSINEFRKLTLSHVLPNLNKGSVEFYDMEKRTLNKKYEWYFSGLRQIAMDCRMISSSGDTLLVLLDQ